MVITHDEQVRLCFCGTFVPWASAAAGAVATKSPPLLRAATAAASAAAALACPLAFPLPVAHCPHLVCNPPACPAQFARLIGTREHAEFMWRITKDEAQRSTITQVRTTCSGCSLLAASGAGVVAYSSGATALLGRIA